MRTLSLLETAVQWNTTAVSNSYSYRPWNKMPVTACSHHPQADKRKIQHKLLSPARTFPNTIITLNTPITEAPQVYPNTAKPPGPPDARHNILMEQKDNQWSEFIYFFHGFFFFFAWRTQKYVCSFFIFPAAGWKLIGLVGWNYFPPAFLTKRSWHFYATVINESLLVWMLDRADFMLLVMNEKRNDLHASNAENTDWFFFCFLFFSTNMMS